jgi:hypothetical protein
VTTQRGGRGLALAVLALAGGACASVPVPVPVRAAEPARCPEGDARLVTILFFGLSTEDGRGVSEQAWQTFLRDVITPRFSEGLTVFAAQGQYADRGGVVVEGTKVVLRIRESSPTADADIAALIAEYKRRFQQQSVLQVDFPACATF